MRIARNSIGSGISITIRKTSLFVGTFKPLVDFNGFFFTFRVSTKSSSKSSSTVSEESARMFSGIDWKTVGELSLNSRPQLLIFVKGVVRIRLHFYYATSGDDTSSKTIEFFIYTSFCNPHK